MAVIYPSLANSWYAAGGGASWVNSNSVYSGVSGGVNYRSCVQINVGDFDGTSSHLIVSFTCNGTSSVAGLYGVLSTNGNIATNCVVSDNYYGSYTNGPHASYLGSGASGYIAESDTYSDAACTALQGSYNQGSGYTCYMKFSSANIRPNTTYYLYLMRYIKSGDSTTSGWSTGYRTSMGATLTYTQNTYYIDVNTYINGGGSTTNANITYNVNINGSRVASGVTDYYTAWPKGTTWSIANASCSGYTCTNSTNTSGTLGTNAVASQWSFSSLHTLTLNPNGGSFSDGGTSAKALSPNLIYGHGNWWDISGHPVAKTGHTFKGWYTATSGGTKVYNADGSCVTGTSYWNSSQQYTQAADLTVYAQYDPNTWTVSYNANGGSSTPADQTKTYGVALTLRGAISRPNATKTITTTFSGNGGTPAAPTVTSTASLEYSFAGWKATNGTVYSAGGSYTANEGTTLTAQWNSGNWEGEEIWLPNAFRDGYTFTGWYTAATGGSRVTSLSPTANTTLYAHWSVNSHNVTLYDTSRDIVITTYNDINFGETITLPSPSSLPVLYNYYADGFIDLVKDSSEGVIPVSTVFGVLSEEHVPDHYIDECFGDSYTGSYTLNVDSDIILELYYRYDGIDVFECTIPEASDLPNELGRSVAYISKYADNTLSFMPDKITPTSYIKVPFVYGMDHSGENFGTYIINYQPEIGARTWIKQNGTYQLATTLIRDNASYSHNNGYLIKYDGKWMSIEEYLSIVQSGTSEAILDSGLLDSIILA